MARRIIIEVPDCCYDCQFNGNYGYPPTAYKRWCSLFTDVIDYNKRKQEWIPHQECLKSTIPELDKTKGVM